MQQLSVNVNQYDLTIVYFFHFVGTLWKPWIWNGTRYVPKATTITEFSYTKSWEGNGHLSFNRTIVLMQLIHRVWSTFWHILVKYSKYFKFVTHHDSVFHCFGPAYLKSSHILILYSVYLQCSDTQVYPLKLPFLVFTVEDQITLKCMFVFGCSVRLRAKLGKSDAVTHWTLP